MSYRIKLTALALCLVLAILLAVSCGTGSELRPYERALADSTPARAAVTTSLDSGIGELNAEYNAVFTGASVSVSYVRDTVSEFDPAVSGSGKITETEGSYTKASDGTVTGEISPLVLSVLTRGISLDAELLTEPKIGEDGTLSFSVSAENTEAVLGTPIGCGVNVKITISEKQITALELSYTAASGDALLKCEYVY